MRKGKDPDSEPDPYLWLMDPDLDLGGPKTSGSYVSGSGSGSGSPTLVQMSLLHQLVLVNLLHTPPPPHPQTSHAAGIQVDTEEVEP
jgi:hypothetical protein